jgi:trans-aconitate 2-methyltransferase
VRLVRADLTTLALGRPVDLVFSTATLHWIPDHERLFANLFRLLAPGGRLVAQYGGAGNLARVVDRVAAWMADPAHAPHSRGFRNSWRFGDPEETSRMLARAGFVAIDAALEPAPARFDGAAEYREFLAKVVLREHLAHLPPSIGAALVDATCDAAARDDPPFMLDYVRLNVSATRR